MAEDEKKDSKTDKNAENAENKESGKKDENLIKGTAYWHKELDIQVIDVKLSRMARELLNEYCVKSNTGQYMDGRDGNVKVRYLIKRIIAGKYDFSGQFGVFFDKALIDSDSKERRMYFQTHGQAIAMAPKIRNFFEDLMNGALEMNKEYKFTVGALKTEDIPESSKRPQNARD